MTDEAGWIPHLGGECPVPPDPPVETLGRTGDRDCEPASFWCWDWSESWPESDIIAYRIIAP